MTHRRFTLLVATIVCGPVIALQGGCDTGGGAKMSATDAGAGGTATGWSGGSGGHTGQSGGQGGGQAGGQAGMGVTDDVAILMQTYRTWQPLSAEAVDISASIFNLCRRPSAAEDEFTSSIHARHALRDWANPQAVAGIAAKGAGGFAAGAAIVKEKFATAAATGSPTLAALGIMVKRAPGFDSARGDWEFIYWNATDGVSRGAGQLATCSDCHAGTRDTDFVFIDQTWRTATPR